MTLHSADLAPPKERWHVGKEIPLVLVVTILSGIAAGIVSYTRMGDRITHNTTTISENNARHVSDTAKAIVRIDGLENDTTALAISLGELKAGQVYIQRTLDGIAADIGERP